MTRRVPRVIDGFPTLPPMLRVLQSADWFHPDGFPIAVERRDPQESFERHTHQFAEIVIITGGRALHVVGRESWELTAGDVFVMSGRRPHEYQRTENLRLINVLFQPRTLDLRLFDLGTLPGYHALFTLESGTQHRRRFESRLRLTPREMAVATGWIDELDEELRGRAPGFGYMSMALFMQLVGFLSRCYGRARGPDARSLPRLAETITHLEMHGTETMRVGALARRAGMSSRSFIRAFRSATGRPPIAYLIELRVNRAAALLRHGTESITEVAFQVGFSDSNYFARQFRRVLGMSPRAYRKLHRV